MRILIIEDNQLLAGALKNHLQQSYAVDLAYSGDKGVNLALVHDYDAILLDLELPMMIGYEVCRQLRDQEIYTPILVISGHDSTGSKVALLNAGADDYVIKPFSTAEIKARLRAVLRRSAHFEKNILEVHPLHLNRITKAVAIRNRPVNLPLKEFLILEHLMLYANTPISRLELLEHVWEGWPDLSSNIIDVHIGNIRRKIGRPESNQLIKTVRGIGYMIPKTQLNNSPPEWQLS